jgi:hypothetical protein
MYWVRSTKEAAGVSAARIVLERGYGRVENADHVLELILDGADDRPSVTVQFIRTNHPEDEDERHSRTVVTFREFTNGSRG